MIPIHVSFRYSKEHNTVTTQVLMPPLPPFCLVMSLEEFHAFCEATGTIVNDFITGLKQHIAEGNETEFKHEASDVDLDKLMHLKHDWDEKRGSDDEATHRSGAVE